MMNDYEYVEMYATKEQLEELKQIKQRVTNLFTDIISKQELNVYEYHFLVKSLESYICDPFIDVYGESIK